MSPFLCLGSAQFGLAYGVTNAAGQVAELEVQNIIDLASANHINWIDTAQAYGNSQKVLGKSFTEGERYNIVSKLSSQGDNSFTKANIGLWDQEFCNILQQLGVTSIDTLLLHSPSDLRKPGGNLLEDWLFKLQHSGLVRRLGISIYSPRDIAHINPHLLEVVQLPMSIYDQRLIHDGTISYLKSLGCSIHARSIYLQGLILQSACQWPGWVDPDVLEKHLALEDLARQKNCSLIDLALSFARQQEYLESVVIGVCSTVELKQLLESWKGPPHWHENEWLDWQIFDEKVLDPRMWPR